MRQVWDSLGGDVAAAAPRYIDGVVYDGVDPAAPRRAHARVLTTARQVAERGQTGPAEPGADRAAVFWVEMARIDAAHRAWLLERGEEVFALPPRGRRRQATSSPRAAGGPEHDDSEDDG